MPAEELFREAASVASSGITVKCKPPALHGGGAGVTEAHLSLMRSRRLSLAVLTTEAVVLPLFGAPLPDAESLHSIAWLNARVGAGHNCKAPELPPAEISR